MKTEPRPEAGCTAVADSLRKHLLAGRYRPGERLPSVRELASGIEFSKDTVAKAYAMLADEGLIDLRFRSRPIVRNVEAVLDARRVNLENKVAAFRRHLNDLGYEPEEIDAIFMRSTRS